VHYHAGHPGIADKVQRHKLQQYQKKSGMQVVDLIQNIFKSGFILVEFCARNPINAPACSSLWAYTAMASGIAGVLLLTWSTLKVMRHYAAVKADEERAAMVADEETIKKHRQHGKEQSLEDDDALEERIRELLAQTRKQVLNLESPKPIRPRRISN
jgi:hypothetical protein